MMTETVQGGRDRTERQRQGKKAATGQERKAWAGQYVREGKEKSLKGSCKGI